VARILLTCHTYTRIHAVRGYDFAHLVKVYVWLEQIKDMPEMEKRFRHYFGEGAFPTRMTATTAFIDGDCMVMIDGVAYRGP
jgi:2-iminobutanoate/2-iminopropanoate deaminase